MAEYNCISIYTYIKISGSGCKLNTSIDLSLAIEEFIFQLGTCLIVADTFSIEAQYSAKYHCYKSIIEVQGE